MTQTRPPLKREPSGVASLLIRLLLTLVMLLAGGWGAFALWYHALGPLALRVIVICLWLTACIGATVSLRRRRVPAALFGVSFLLLLAWWHTLQPSHNRRWADDVAQLLRGDVRGDIVTLYNVRNFSWRTTSDYTPRWETREYDLSQLVSADLILSYWMGPAIAHTLVSFGFTDGRQLVFSLEIRKERDEAFSAVAGFFRQYETVLVASDERDIVLTRTNARGEDVYLYRLNLPPVALRTAFLGYVEQANALARTPAFYNSLTSNCTTIVFDLARLIAPGLPMDYRLLASGYFAEYAYDQQGLTPGVPFDTLHERGRITQRALEAGDTPDFSRRIREGVPGISQSAPATLR